MNEILLLEKDIKDRIKKKLKRAESAYVKARTQKETLNCKHRGPQLSERIFVCKINCCGADGNSAAQCWRQKAAACEEFQLAQSVESIRSEFREMNMNEITLRWPQLGELFWTLKKIKQLKSSTDKVENVDLGDFRY